MLKRLSLLLIGVAIAIASPGSAARADEVEDAARAFLAQLDRQDYSAAWGLLHPEYQKLGKFETWRGKMEAARAGLGKNLTRTDTGMRDYSQQVVYMTPGQFMILRFSSHFEHRDEALEVVVLKYTEGKGAGWKPAGYSVR